MIKASPTRRPSRLPVAVNVTDKHEDKTGNIEDGHADAVQDVENGLEHKAEHDVGESEYSHKLMELEVNNLFCLLALL